MASIAKRRFVPAQFHGRTVEQSAPFNGLTDGKNHVLTFNRNCLIVVIDRCEPVLGVENGNAFSEYNRLYLTGSIL